MPVTFSRGTKPVIGNSSCPGFHAVPNNMSKTGNFAKVLVPVLRLNGMVDSMVLRIIYNQRKASPRQSHVQMSHPITGEKIEQHNRCLHLLWNLEDDPQYGETCWYEVFKPKWRAPVTMLKASAL